MKRQFLLALMLLVISFSLLGMGFSQRKIDLYENMVNASVLISNDNGWGSGVFLYDNVIVTAAHVLEHPDLIVEFTDGTMFDINDYYIDDIEDVGFIFVDANEPYLPQLSVTVGDIGDTVYLVGAPYDRKLKFSLTKGILSNLCRSVFSWKDLVQTDAESGPGSSGGPLYNSKGDIIGICVANPNRSGGVTLCQSGESILDAYERYKNAIDFQGN